MTKHDYKLWRKGKIRRMYEYSDDYLIMHTTDNVSAFDFVLPDTIPGKGGILTRISEFWMQRFENVIPNHFMGGMRINSSIFDEPGDAIIVKRLRPLLIEAVVRQYVIGSGWKDYNANGAICGIKLPAGLQLAEKLDYPIFTPATKAPQGEHDENISFNAMADIVGTYLASKIHDISIYMFQAASRLLEARGILLADTKFEFGVNEQGKLYLIDEVLTPDSSRYWDKNKYRVGTSPESFDKQIIRDYLELINWDKKPPVPHLPQGIIEKTAKRYREIEAKIIH